MERMMNYILCGLAIYGFIGLALFVAINFHSHGEYFRALNESLDRELTPEFEHLRSRIEILTIFITVPAYVMAWPFCYNWKNVLRSTGRIFK